jgi:membrane protein YqaA with SNARE-associated domain
MTAGFGMPVPSSVFLSCGVDVINSIVLGIFYALQRRVNLFFLLVLAPPASVFAALFYYILGKYVIDDMAQPCWLADQHRQPLCIAVT